jgi:DNA mismatch repair protein MutL
MGHVGDTLSAIALGWPSVRFRLAHNGRRIRDWPPAPDPADRVADVLGKDSRPDLHAIEFNHNGLSISGWICSPRVTRRTSRGLYIFVNGRFVRDRTVQHGIFKGFAQRLVKGQFPVAVVFIKIPFDQVDVNVHPAKNEVRFVKPQAVHEAVKSAIAQTLYEVDRVDWLPPDRQQNQQPQNLTRIADPLSSYRPVGRKEFGIWNAEFGIKNGEKEAVASSQKQEARSQRQQEPVFDTKGFSALRVVGQLHNTYIVCESDAGLVLIDHHAAHERILYEQLQRRAADQPSVAQKLVVPETLELNFSEAEILGQLMADLKLLGLEVEPFGKNTFVVKAVPLLLAGRDVRPLIYEIVEKIAAASDSSGLKAVLDECRRVMACHGAMRANQTLDGQQIRKLLQQLDDCENPSHCPHGRPTWVRWDLDTLEKSFKRIV